MRLWNRLKNTIRLYPMVVIWWINLLVCELFLPWMWVSYRCHWFQDKDSTWHPLATAGDGISPSDIIPSKLLIVADPQLTDAYSYSQSPGLGLTLVQMYSDIYMKKNFAHILNVFQPNAVLFLGDLMDGGREWVGSRNDLFQDELVRFYRIFGKEGPERQYYYDVGNHDIGFGRFVVSEAYQRFQTVFSQPNYAFTMGKFHIVVLDTISLSAGRNNPISKDAFEFLDQMNANHSRRVLISHVPLYRPDNSDCGLLRNRPALNQGRGYQYQNLIEESLTQEILVKVQPSIIFSGDDHDHCLYHHPQAESRKRTIPEHSIPTFSWLMGNKYPGYAIVSLNVDLLGDDGLPDVAICPLIPQFNIYLWYIILGNVTWVSVLVQVIKSRHRYSVIGSSFVEQYRLLPISQHPSSHPDSPGAESPIVQKPSRVCSRVVWVLCKHMMIVLIMALSFYILLVLPFAVGH